MYVCIYVKKEVIMASWTSCRYINTGCLHIIHDVYMCMIMTYMTYTIE